MECRTLSFYLLTYRLLEILNLSEFRSGTPQTIGKEEVTFLDVIPSEFRRKFADRKRAICLSCDIHIVFSPDEVKDLRIVRGEYDACSIWVGILIIKQLQDHLYHLFVEMIFQFIYDQVTTCSEDCESPTDQSMSFDRSGRNNPIQLDRISGLKNVIIVLKFQSPLKSVIDIICCPQIFDIVIERIQDSFWRFSQHWRNEMVIDP